MKQLRLLLTVYNVYIRCNELRQELSKLNIFLIFLAKLDPLEQEFSVKVQIRFEQTVHTNQRS